VYWDLLSNVFNMQGPDDNFYSVNGFVHDGTDWANAQYHSLSGNVSFGDGKPPYDKERTRIDCLGHELGHAFNDHQVHYDGDSDGLNESLADIFGEWTDAYLKSGFATHATVVGDIADANWTNNCSGRSMINPGASGKPALWFSGIEDIEEHDGSRPASRAFTFLARGASAFLKSSSYSPKLPWGMRGVGLQDAARTYFNGVKSFTDPDAGYAGQRSALRQAAALLFGVNTSQHLAVANAYAGINVGGLAAGYPAAPTASPEVEPNDSMTHPQTVVFNQPIPAGVVVTAPRKRKFHAASGSSDDWYRVEVPEGKSFAARVSQDQFTSMATVELVDIYQTYASQTAGASAATVSVTSLCFGSPSCTYWVHVHPIVVTGGYTIDLDLEQ
jgi:thermolysin metallopeptidase-like protein